ncbi:MAG: hypothetical protein ACP5SF_00070 [Thermoplasmata archaeon]
MIKMSDLKNGIPISDDPYGDLAKRLSIQKDELIYELKELLISGQIVKFKALLDHEKLGFKVNALIAMDGKNINAESILHLGIISHFYIREPNKKFPYKYYVMAHFRNENELICFSENLEKMHIKHEILRTLRNLRSDKK